MPAARKPRVGVLPTVEADFLVSRRSRFASRDARGASVDQAGDGGADGDGGDERKPKNDAGVAGGERAGRFGDEDDAVGAEVGQRDEGDEGEVAGAADDGVAPATLGKSAGSGTGLARIGDRDNVPRAVQAGDGDRPLT
jgi:hypothetical protein